MPIHFIFINNKSHASMVNGGAMSNIIIITVCGDRCVVCGARY